MEVIYFFFLYKTLGGAQISGSLREQLLWKRGATTAVWPRFILNSDPSCCPVEGQRDRRGVRGWGGGGGVPFGSYTNNLNQQFLKLKRKICPSTTSFSFDASRWPLTFSQSPRRAVGISTHLLRSCSRGRGSATCCPGRWWSRPRTGRTPACCPTDPAPPSSPPRLEAPPWRGGCGSDGLPLLLWGERKPTEKGWFRLEKVGKEKQKQTTNNSKRMSTFHRGVTSEASLGVEGVWRSLSRKAESFSI